MSMLEDIKAAEQKADDLKKQATLEARNTVRNAQAEAHKEADALIAEARKQAAAAIAQAEARQNRKRTPWWKKTGNGMKPRRRKPGKIWMRQSSIL